MSVTDNLTDAIAAQLGVPMVTRWVLVAETIEENGEPTVHSLSSPGLPLWARYGLLSWEAQGCVPPADMDRIHGGRVNPEVAHACEVLAETGTCPHIIRADGSMAATSINGGTIAAHSITRAPGFEQAIEDVLAAWHLDRRVEQYQRRARLRAIGGSIIFWLILAATVTLLAWVVIR